MSCPHLVVVMSVAAISVGSFQAQAQAQTGSQAQLQNQPVSIQGIVVDARTGQPLSDVRIQVEGQTVSVDSDAAGRFTLPLPAGHYTLVASLVGYALVRQPIDVTSATASAEPVRIELSEGAGTFEQHVTVAGVAPREAEAAPAGAMLYGRDLQALRGITLDDPIRALHALPAVAATDDFYSEFTVRGLDFAHTGLVVDGMPSSYLMHSVFGVTDGGSIAMLNSDAIASLSLMPGSYPQRLGRRLGAQVDVETRDGDRTGIRGRVGLSGTSATALVEGPFRGSRGSWLVTARRSYLDLILNRIDEENSLAFGFSDVLGKATWDITPKHQIQILSVFGASRFDEKPERLGLNDQALVTGHSWLSGLTWRYAPSSSIAVVQRVYTTGLTFHDINKAGDALDDSHANDLGWRATATMALKRGWLAEFGADAQHSVGDHAMRRSLNDSPTLTLLNSYDATGGAASGYALVTFTGWSRLTVTPGVRADYWRATHTSTSSPWLNAEVTVTPKTHVRAGGGVYRQFADLEHIYGIRGGGTDLRPETANHADVGVIQQLPFATSLQLTAYAREEHDVLWAPGSESRRLSPATFTFGRTNAPWVNRLDGRARGVEIVWRRDAPGGLTGWASYAYNRHRYTDTATGESFWADVDQRHTVSLFGNLRLTNRTTVGAKYRYGSNYPLVGYIVEQTPATNSPVFSNDGLPLFMTLGTVRNTLRLPAYSRLDVRADHAFNWSRHRITLFVEVANALNHQNLRTVPFDIGRNGQVSGATDTLLPIIPSAGFVIEF